MNFADLYGEPPSVTSRPKAGVRVKNKQHLLAAIQAVRPFVPPSQMNVMLDSLHGEEGGHFEDTFVRLQALVSAMPLTGQTDGMAQKAVVHLHYFMGAMDWHITEKDIEGDGTVQAFGLANLGYGAELGYVSILELCSIKGMQLDLYWLPATLESIKAKGL